MIALLGLVAAAACGGIAVGLSIWAWCGHRSAVEPVESEPAGRWFALPGERLELAETGFVITRGTAADDPVYALRTPEGWLWAVGVDLALLQAFAEKKASERAQFSITSSPARQEAERAIGAARAYRAEP